MKAKVALAVAIALAILAAVGIRAYLTRQREETVRTHQTVSVLVATQSIRRGTEITGAMLGTQEMPVEALGREDQMILAREMDTIVGQTVQKDLRADDILYRSDFARGTDRADVTQTLPEQGRVVMAVPVDKVTGVAGHLLPGSVVDVLVTRQHSDAGGATRTETRTTITGVEVVAVDLHMSRPDQFVSLDHRRDYAAYSTVLLRVSHREANILAHLTQTGRIHLATRRPTDPGLEDPTELGEVTPDNLEEQIREAARERAEARRSGAN